MGTQDLASMGVESERERRAERVVGGLGNSEGEEGVSVPLIM